MPYRRVVRGWLAGVAVALAAAALVAADQPTSGLRRDVHLSAVDRNGAHVTDLTAADLTVRESGQERHILRLERATSRLTVALAVEESLAPDIAVRRALASFIDRIHEAGDVALYVIGRQTEKRADYTTDIVRLADAINAFPARAVYDGNLVEGLVEIAREQRAREGRRVIIALGMEIPQVSSVPATAMLDQLRDGGAVFHAATLLTFRSAGGPASSGGRDLALENQIAGIERDRLFAQGPQQSGGLHLSTPRTEALIPAMHRIATDLRNQYLLSYVVPEGARADGNVSVSTRRQDVVIRAPTRLRPF